MPRTPTQPPEGYERVASYTFPSLHGPWKPSKVHLRVVDSGGGPLCGTRLGRKRSSRDYEFGDHEQEAGLCKACWEKAAK